MSMLSDKPAPSTANEHAAGLAWMHLTRFIRLMNRSLLTKFEMEPKPSSPPLSTNPASTEQQASSLLYTLKQNPEKRHLNCSLTVIISARDTDDNEQIPAHRCLRILFFKNLPALEHVYLLTSAFMSIMIYMKDCVRGKVSLTKVQIVSHGPRLTMSMSYFWSVFKAFPNLDDFCFEFAGTDGRKEETPGTLPVGLLLHRRNVLDGQIFDTLKGCSHNRQVNRR